MSITVRLTTPVYPTEDVSKVMDAISSIFDVSEAKFHEQLINDSNRGIDILMLEFEGGVEMLEPFHTKLRQLKILDTARSVLEKNLLDREFFFYLNKHVAYVGRISFVEGDEPHGAIKITVQAPQELISEVVNWLAPETKDGVPLYEIDMPH